MVICQVISMMNFLEGFAIFIKTIPSIITIHNSIIYLIVIILFNDD